jgi:hypothetical protein
MEMEPLLCLLMLCYCFVFEGKVLDIDVAIASFVGPIV